MEVITIENLTNLKVNCAVAIGFFDGIHLGHQVVIENITKYAKANQLKSVVITFDRSPKVALGYATDDGHITPLSEKLRIFKEIGIDYTLILKFDTTLLNLTAQDFIQTYLLETNVHLVSIGFDFRFGQGGAGDANYLATQKTFKVEVAQPVLISNIKISTTEIKNALKEGNLPVANQMLGRAFSISGEVVYGKQLGQTIGFPTANLKIDKDYLLPERGVYATVTHIDGTKFASMTNVGFNPTANLSETISIETHLLDCEQDLYGKILQIEFHKKIRDEMKFESLDALVEQLKQDKKFVETMPIQT